MVFIYRVLMKILTKYLFSTIITYVSLVVLFLLGLQIFVEFIHEFSSLGIGNYGLYQLITCVLLMLPYDIYQFFPMASLLGFIIGLGLLASHSELIVMRVSGMSLVNIASAVTKVGVVLLLVMVILGEVVSPMAQSKAFRIKTAAISGGQVLLTRQGIWLNHQGGITNVGSVLNRGKLQNITSYKFDNNNVKLQTISHATAGIYKDSKWVFNDVVQTNFKDNNITNASFSKQQSELKFNPKLVGITRIDPDHKNLFSLYSYIKYRKQIGLDAASYLFAFWQRVFAPLAILVMILLAIPFIFGSLRSATMGLRMLVGVMFGFSFYILHQFVGPMSIVYHVPPLLASILPLLIFTIIGILLLSRVR